MKFERPLLGVNYSYQMDQRSYLLTGASGFLGSIMSANLGGKILSLGRSESSDIVCNLSTEVPAVPKVDVVVHNAGKAHIYPKSEAEKKEFYAVNAEGTGNLLRSLENAVPDQFVFISTISVYGLDYGDAITEDYELKGTSPYADSKIQAENMVRKWGEEKGVPVLILRIPLVAGPNPPGNLGKMIKGISTGKYLSLNKGKARRSVVLATDVARLIQKSFGKSGTYNLSDGVHPTFRDFEQVICKQLKKPIPRNIPLWLATALGRIGGLIPGSPVNYATVQKMTLNLTVSDQKARKELNWNPKPVIENFKIA